ncbi:hypothetical protein VU12_12780 [Desulfobulbus sp. US4]|nr:hypothetical protein [Desulfobulbus sp. US4]
MSIFQGIDYWIVALFIYIAALLWTFRPTYNAFRQKIIPNPGGDSFEESPYFSEESKQALKQHFSRLGGTLGYWKNKAAFYEVLLVLDDTIGSIDSYINKRDI